MLLPVWRYCTQFCEVPADAYLNFLLTAGEIGCIFKKGATISAALGGCQAEIGVSSAMAAAALTECLGGGPEQAAQAAEIAMEHHLGMTCDPVGGLVQIPCIERNAMGAVKAITAAQLALQRDPAEARVSLAMRGGRQSPSLTSHRRAWYGGKISRKRADHGSNKG